MACLVLFLGTITVKFYKIKRLLIIEQPFFMKSRIYIISIAQTKEVVTKGMMRVSHGQWLIIANANAADEMKNISQAAPRYFLF